MGVSTGCTRAVVERVRLNRSVEVGRASLPSSGEIGIVFSSISLTRTDKIARIRALGGKLKISWIASFNAVC